MVCIKSQSAGCVTLKLRVAPSINSGLEPDNSMALASSVAPEPTRSMAALSGPMRNIWGVWASHLSLRSTVDATRTPPGPSIDVLSVSASLWASKPPTPSCWQVTS